MTIKHRRIFRGIAFALAISFSLQEIAPAATLENIAMPARDALLDPTRFEIPAEFATLKEVHKGASGTFIIHVQDAHSNFSGQQSLANGLDYILSNYGVSLVLVEGGSTDNSLTPLKELAPPEIWKRVAKSFLVQGKISGEEYLNLVSDHPMKIMGIEDRELYMKSVRHYSDLADKRHEILEYLKMIRRSIEKLKSVFYPAELRDYERRKGVAAAADAETDFRALIELARTHPAEIEGLENLKRLIALEDKEKRIDFTAANLEQAALVERLSKSGGLKDVHAYLDRMARLKNAKVAQYTSLQNLLEAARKNGLRVDDYPNLAVYLEYLADFARLEFDALLAEAERAEDRIYRTILESPDARLVRAIDRYLGLLVTAYKIQMTTRDFEVFSRNEPDFATVATLAFLNRKLAEAGYFDAVLPYRSLLEDGKKALDQFYASVADRDFAFVRNAERILNQEAQKVAVLISGGYHTPHLKKLMREKGYSYAVLTPVITTETNHEKYERLLLAPVRKATRRIETVSGESRADKSPSALEADLVRVRDGDRLRVLGTAETVAVGTKEEWDGSRAHELAAAAKDSAVSAGVNGPLTVDEALTRLSVGVSAQLLENAIDRRSPQEARSVRRPPTSEIAAKTSPRGTSRDASFSLRRSGSGARLGRMLSTMAEPSQALVAGWESSVEVTQSRQTDELAQAKVALADDSEFPHQMIDLVRVRLYAVPAQGEAFVPATDGTVPLYAYATEEGGALKIFVTASFADRLVADRKRLLLKQLIDSAWMQYVEKARLEIIESSVDPRYPAAGDPSRPSAFDALLIETMARQGHDGFLKAWQDELAADPGEYAFALATEIRKHRARAALNLGDENRIAAVMAETLEAATEGDRRLDRARRDFADASAQFVATRNPADGEAVRNAARECLRALGDIRVAAAVNAHNLTDGGQSSLLVMEKLLDRLIDLARNFPDQYERRGDVQYVDFAQVTLPMKDLNARGYDEANEVKRVFLEKVRQVIEQRKLARRDRSPEDRSSLVEAELPGEGYMQTRLYLIDVGVERYEDIRKAWREAVEEVKGHPVFGPKLAGLDPDRLPIAFGHTKTSVNGTNGLFERHVRRTQEAAQAGVAGVTPETVDGIIALVREHRRISELTREEIANEDAGYIEGVRQRMASLYATTSRMVDDLNEEVTARAQVAETLPGPNQVIGTWQTEFERARTDALLLDRAADLEAGRRKSVPVGKYLSREQKDNETTMPRLSHEIRQHDRALSWLDAFLRDAIDDPAVVERHSVFESDFLEFHGLFQSMLLNSMKDPRYDGLYKPHLMKALLAEDARVELLAAHLEAVSLASLAREWKSPFRVTKQGDEIEFYMKVRTENGSVEIRQVLGEMFKANARNERYPPGPRDNFFYDLFEALHEAYREFHKDREDLPFESIDEARRFARLMEQRFLSAKSRVPDTPFYRGPNGEGFTPMSKPAVIVRTGRPDIVIPPQRVGPTLRPGDQPEVRSLTYDLSEKVPERFKIYEIKLASKQDPVLFVYDEKKRTVHYMVWTELSDGTDKPRKAPADEELMAALEADPSAARPVIGHTALTMTDGLSWPLGVNNWAVNTVQKGLNPARARAALARVSSAPATPETAAALEMVAAAIPGFDAQRPETLDFEPNFMDIGTVKAVLALQKAARGLAGSPKGARLPVYDALLALYARARRTVSDWTAPKATVDTLQASALRAGVPEKIAAILRYDAGFVPGERRRRPAMGGYETFAHPENLLQNASAVPGVSFRTIDEAVRYIAREEPFLTQSFYPYDRFHGGTMPAPYEEIIIAPQADGRLRVWAVSGRWERLREPAPSIDETIPPMTRVDLRDLKAGDLVRFHIRYMGDTAFYTIRMEGDSIVTAWLSGSDTPLRGKVAFLESIKELEGGRQQIFPAQIDERLRIFMPYFSSEWDAAGVDTLDGSNQWSDYPSKILVQKAARLSGTRLDSMQFELPGDLAPRGARLPRAEEIRGLARQRQIDVGVVEARSDALPGKAILEDIPASMRQRYVAAMRERYSEIYDDADFALDKNFARAIGQVASLPKVYYTGLGVETRTDQETGRTRLGVLQALLTTDFGELVGCEVLRIGFDAFREEMEKQLDGLTDGKIVFRRESGTKFVAEFSFEGKPRRVIAYYGFDALRRLPKELRSGYDVLLHEVGVPQPSWFDILWVRLFNRPRPGFRAVTREWFSRLKPESGFIIDAGPITRGVFGTMFGSLLYDVEYSEQAEEIIRAAKFSEIYTDAYYKLGHEALDEHRHRDGYRPVLLTKNPVALAKSPEATEEARSKSGSRLSDEEIKKLAVQALREKKVKLLSSGAEYVVYESPLLPGYVIKVPRDPGTKLPEVAAAIPPSAETRRRVARELFEKRAAVESIALDLKDRDRAVEVIVQPRIRTLAEYLDEPAKEARAKRARRVLLALANHHLRLWRKGYLDADFHNLENVGIAVDGLLLSIDTGYVYPIGTPEETRAFLKEHPAGALSVGEFLILGLFYKFNPILKKDKDVREAYAEFLQVFFPGFHSRQLQAVMQLLMDSMQGNRNIPEDQIIREYLPILRNQDNATVINALIDALPLDSATEVIAGARLRSFDIDENERLAFVAAHPLGFQRRAVDHLSRSISFISEEEFNAAMEETVRDFLARQGDRPYVMLAPMNDHPDKGRSRRWMEKNAIDRGLLKPEQYLNAFQMNLWLEERRRRGEPEIVDVVVIDDFAASGRQLALSAKMDHSLLPENVRLHILVPFMTQEAVRMMTPVSWTSMYKHRTIPSLEEVIAAAGVDPNAGLKERLLGIIDRRRLRRAARELLTADAKFSNNDLRSMVLTYFWHKLPDYVSFPSSIAKGTTPDGIAHRFLPEITPPYASQGAAGTRLPHQPPARHVFETDVPNLPKNEGGAYEWNVFNYQPSMGPLFRQEHYLTFSPEKVKPLSAGYNPESPVFWKVARHTQSLDFIELVSPMGERRFFKSGFVRRAQGNFFRVELTPKSKTPWANEVTVEPALTEDVIRAQATPFQASEIPRIADSLADRLANVSADANPQHYQGTRRGVLRQNAAEAYRYLLGLLAAGQPLTRDHIRRLNEILNQNLLGADQYKSGILRGTVGAVVSGGVSYPVDLRETESADLHGPAILFFYAPAATVPQRLDDFLTHYNALGPGSLFGNVAALNQEFIGIHPFIDGNGKTIRALLDGALLVKMAMPALPHSQHTRNVLYDDAENVARRMRRSYETGARLTEAEFEARSGTYLRGEVDFLSPAGKYPLRISPELLRRILDQAAGLGGASLAARRRAARVIERLVADGNKDMCSAAVLLDFFAQTVDLEPVVATDLGERHVVRRNAIMTLIQAAVVAPYGDITLLEDAGIESLVKELIAQGKTTERLESSLETLISSDAERDEAAAVFENFNGYLKWLASDFQKFERLKSFLVVLRRPEALADKHPGEVAQALRSVVDKDFNLNFLNDELLREYARYPKLATTLLYLIISHAGLSTALKYKIARKLYAAWLENVSAESIRAYLADGRFQVFEAAGVERNQRVLRGREIIRASGMTDQWNRAESLGEALALFSVTAEKQIELAAVYFRERYDSSLEVVTRELPAAHLPLDADKKPVIPLGPEDYSQLVSRLKEWANALDSMDPAWLLLSASLGTLTVAKFGWASHQQGGERGTLFLNNDARVLWHEVGHGEDPGGLWGYSEPTAEAAMPGLASKYDYEDVPNLRTLVQKVFEKRRDAWLALKRASADLGEKGAVKKALYQLNGSLPETALVKVDALYDSTALGTTDTSWLRFELTRLVATTDFWHTYAFEVPEGDDYPTIEVPGSGLRVRQGYEEWWAEVFAAVDLDKTDPEAYELRKMILGDRGRWRQKEGSMGDRAGARIAALVQFLEGFPGFPQGQAQAVLEGLPEEVVGRAFVRRFNLLSDFYRRRFLVSWQTNPASAITEDLAVGFLTRHTLNSQGALFLRELPEGIEHADWKMDIDREQIFMSNGYVNKEANVEWSYSQDLSAWVPIAISSVDGSVTTSYFKSIADVEGKILKVGVKFTQDRLKRYIRDHGDLDIFSRVSPEGIISIGRRTLPGGRSIGGYEFALRGDENYKARMGRDAVLTQIHFAGDAEPVTLRVAVQKNDGGEVTRVLESHVFFEGHHLSGLSREVGFFWIQGLRVEKSADVERPWAKLTVGANAVPESGEVFTHQYDLPPEFAEHWAEALIGESGVPVFLRIKGEEGEADSERVLKRVEIRKADMLERVTDSYYEKVHPPGVSHALAIAMKSGSQVVVSRLTVSHYKPSVRQVKAGGVVIDIPAAMMQGLPSDLAAEIVFEGPSVVTPTPSVLRVGVLDLDPNRYQDARFEPIASYKLKPIVTNRFVAVSPDVSGARLTRRAFLEAMASAVTTAMTSPSAIPQALASIANVDPVDALLREGLEDLGSAGVLAISDDPDTFDIVTLSLEERIGLELPTTYVRNAGNIAQALLRRAREEMLARIAALRKLPSASGPDFLVLVRQVIAQVREEFDLSLEDSVFRGARAYMLRGGTPDAALKELDGIRQRPDVVQERLSHIERNRERRATEEKLSAYLKRNTREIEDETRALRALVTQMRLELAEPEIQDAIGADFAFIQAELDAAEDRVRRNEAELARIKELRASFRGARLVPPRVLEYGEYKVEISSDVSGDKTALKGIVLRGDLRVGYVEFAISGRRRSVWVLMFSPNFEAGLGLGRRLLRDLLVDYPGYTVLSRGSESFQNAFKSLEGFGPITEVHDGAEFKKIKDRGYKRLLSSSKGDVFYWRQRWDYTTVYGRVPKKKSPGLRGARISLRDFTDKEIKLDAYGYVDAGMEPLMDMAFSYPPGGHAEVLAEAERLEVEIKAKLGAVAPESLESMIRSWEFVVGNRVIRPIRKAMELAKLLDGGDPLEAIRLAARESDVAYPLASILLESHADDLPMIARFYAAFLANAQYPSARILYEHLIKRFQGRFNDFKRFLIKEGFEAARIVEREGFYQDEGARRGRDFIAAARRQEEWAGAFSLGGALALFPHATVPQKLDLAAAYFADRFAMRLEVAYKGMPDMPTDADDVPVKPFDIGPDGLRILESLEKISGLWGHFHPRFTTLNGDFRILIFAAGGRAFHGGGRMLLTLSGDLIATAIHESGHAFDVANPGYSMIATVDVPAINALPSSVKFGLRLKGEDPEADCAALAELIQKMFEERRDRWVEAFKAFGRRTFAEVEPGSRGDGYQKAFLADLKRDAQPEAIRKHLTAIVGEKVAIDEEFVDEIADIYARIVRRVGESPGNQNIAHWQGLADELGSAIFAILLTWRLMENELPISSRMYAFEIPKKDLGKFPAHSDPSFLRTLREKGNEYFAEYLTRALISAPELLERIDPEAFALAKALHAGAFDPDQSFEVGLDFISAPAPQSGSRLSIGEIPEEDGAPQGSRVSETPEPEAPFSLQVFYDAPLTALSVTTVDQVRDDAASFKLIASAVATRDTPLTSSDLVPFSFNVEGQFRSALINANKTTVSFFGVTGIHTRIGVLPLPQLAAPVLIVSPEAATREIPSHTEAVDNYGRLSREGERLSGSAKLEGTLILNLIVSGLDVGPMNEAAEAIRKYFQARRDQNKDFTARAILRWVDENGVPLEDDALARLNLKSDPLPDAIEGAEIMYVGVPTSAILEKAAGENAGLLGTPSFEAGNGQGNLIPEVPTLQGAVFLAMSEHTPAVARFLGHLIYGATVATPLSSEDYKLLKTVTPGNEQLDRRLKLVVKPLLTALFDDLRALRARLKSVDAAA